MHYLLTSQIRIGMAALLLGYSLMYGPDYTLSHREGGQKPLAGVVGAAPTLTVSKTVVLLLYETPSSGSTMVKPIYN